MNTPYQILNISPDSNDAEIKLAYLKKVKDNPPGDNQKQFQLVHDAYTLIKDLKSRTHYALFYIPTSNFDDFIDKILETEQTVQLSPKHFNKLLFASIDESTIQNTFANS